MDTIPGSFVDKSISKLKWHRQPWDDEAGRAYRAEVDDGILAAILSHDPAAKDGSLLWHLSVSHRSRIIGGDARLPTWDELKHAKFTLMPVDIPMVLIFPRRAVRYTNIHETTLHLWEAETGIDE